MKYLSVFTLFALLTIWAGLAFATKYNHTTNNYYITEVEESTTINNTQSYDSSMAQLMAADAIHCTTSTRKRQVGIGTGYKNGENGYAIGGCQTFLREDGIPVMIGIKAAGASGTGPSYSLGVNWTF